MKEVCFFVMLCWIFVEPLKIGRPPSWLEEPPPKIWLDPQMGGDVTCKAMGSPIPDVYWYNSRGRPVMPVPGYMQVISNNTLHFYPQRRNFGSSSTDTDYHCRATNTLGTLVGRSVSIETMPNEAWQIRPKDHHVVIGNVAVINCGIPKHLREVISVTSWQNERINYFPGHGADNRIQMAFSGELIIKNVTTHDQRMRLRCRTLNKLTGETRQTTNSIRIYVTEASRESRPMIADMPSIVTIQRGSPASLVCPATGTPPPDIAWEMVKDSSRQSSLNPYWNNGPSYSVDQYNKIYSKDRPLSTDHLFNIRNTKDSHTGTYICQARNPLGTATKKVVLEITTPLEVHIEPPSLEVAARKRATFTCNVPANGYTSIRWIKDGIDIVPGGKIHLTSKDEVLVIDSVAASDEGIYQCIVTRQSEMSIGTTYLSLGDTPPTFLYRFIEQTTQPGPSVSLKCIASGTPTPSIHWTLDGYTITHNDRIVRGQFVAYGGHVIAHVNISSVAPIDGGLYACTASNRVASTTHSARLNVYGLPVVRPMTDVQAVAGDILALHCPVGGYPVHSISWSKGGTKLPLSRRQTLHSNGSLIVQNVQPDTDRGNYACTASARNGHSSTQSVRVHVLIPPRILPFPTVHNLREGSQLTLPCSVTEGDLPLRFSWLFNGRPVSGVPHLTINRLGDYSSYLGINDITKKHSGNYTCSIANNAANVSRTASIIVQVPPRISPFSFRNNAVTGIRLQVICTLEQGDLPITISWYKDGIPLRKPNDQFSLEKDLDIKIMEIDIFSSVLTISSVDRRHRGNYTCVASNKARKDTHTSHLTVSVPPQWVVEPYDLSVIEGKPARLPCKAEGFPPPTSTWRKLQGAKPGLYADISTLGNNVHVLANGSLVIPNAKSSVTGKFLCEVHNGIGAGLSKVVSLIVKIPPTFLHRVQNESVGLGESITLSCSVAGDSPMDLVWLKNGYSLDHQNSFKYKFLKPNSATKQSRSVYQLSINRVTSQDGGEYKCKATNEHGFDVKIIFLSVMESPKSPSSLQVVSKSSRTLQLRWSVPHNGNSPLTKYVIKYKKEPNLPNSMFANEELELDASETDVTIRDLNPSSTYIFTITAHNEIGMSASSKPLQVTTEGESPETSPTDIQVQADTSSSIKITWKPPDPSKSHGNIISYNIGIKEHGTPEDSFLFESVNANESYEQCCSYFKFRLRPNTMYVVIVQAVNKYGNGPLSKEYMVTTLEDVPSTAPRSVTCPTISSTSILVSWSEISRLEARGNVLGYKVSYYPQNNVTAMKEEATSSLTRKLSGLSPYMNYSIQVKAFTSVGNGPPSAIITCQTEEDVPGAPAGVKAMPNKDGSIIVSWLPPSKSYGKILSYTISTRTSDRKSKKYIVQHPRTKFMGEIPKGHSNLEVTVSASTRVGEGLPSAPVTVSHRNGVVPATIMSWGKEVAIHLEQDVTLNCDAVGVPRISRKWYKDGIPLRENKNDIKLYTDGSVALRSLTEEYEGNYTCMVHNTNANDSISYIVRVQTPPSAPIIRLSKATSDTLVLLWKVQNTGGTPLTEVNVSYKKNYGEWIQQKVSIADDTHTIENLDCGTSYDIFFTAHNEVGSGPNSEVLTTKTKGSPPIADKNLSGVVSPKDTWAFMDFTSWSDGGCSIRLFSVAYRAQNHESWIIVSESVKQNQVTISGLRPNTIYIARVTAHNAAGTTSTDYSFTTTQSAAAIPSSQRGSFVNYFTFLGELRVILPIVASFFVLLATCITVMVYMKRRPPANNSDLGSDSALDGQYAGKEFNLSKEHFYATIQKNSSPYMSSRSKEDLYAHDDTLTMYSVAPVKQTKKQAQLRPNNQGVSHKLHNQAFNQLSSREENEFKASRLIPMKEHRPSSHIEEQHRKHQISREQRQPALLPYAKPKPVPFHFFDKNRLDKNVQPARKMNAEYLSLEPSKPFQQYQIKSESDEYDTFGSDSEMDAGPIRQEPRLK